MCEIRQPGAPGHLLILIRPPSEGDEAGRRCCGLPREERTALPDHCAGPERPCCRWTQQLTRMKREVVVSVFLMDIAGDHGSIASWLVMHSRAARLPVNLAESGLESCKTRCLICLPPQLSSRFILKILQLSKLFACTPAHKCTNTELKSAKSMETPPMQHVPLSLSAEAVTHTQNLQPSKGSTYCSEIKSFFLI